MFFDELQKMVHEISASMNFEEAGVKIEAQIFQLTADELLPLIVHTGTIPENIAHDSTEEKLYAKTADIILARCFQLLGLSAVIIRTRANCADVSAKSIYHSYTLVGDAKAFRLSRTAKNQKDFKVQSMVHWKGDCDFAVLVAPLFQYPRSRSQIYTQALDGNVFLFSWEHLAFLISNHICEDENFSLRNIWNSSKLIAKNFSRADKEVIFWDKQDELLCKHIHIPAEQMQLFFSQCKKELILRGKQEIYYCENEIAEIQNYTREEAIAELIKTKKIKEKIDVIRRYISFLGQKS